MSSLEPFLMKVRGSSFSNVQNLGPGKSRPIIPTDGCILLQT